MAAEVGLARTLQPDHHDRHRRHGGQVERRFVGAEHGDQLVMDDLDDHLAGRDRADHLLADRLLAHLGDEILDHRQGDVGLEQRHAHFAHGLGHVGLAQRAAAGQPVENPGQFRAQTFKHAVFPMPWLKEAVLLPPRQAKNASARHSRTGGHSPPQGWRDKNETALERAEVRPGRAEESRNRVSGLAPAPTIPPQSSGRRG